MINYNYPNNNNNNNNNDNTLTLCILYTWYPELPEWLIFYNLDGKVLPLLAVLGVKGEVHHVEEEVVLGAGVLELFIILNSQPLAGDTFRKLFNSFHFISVLFFNQKLI